MNEQQSTKIESTEENLSRVASELSHRKFRALSKIVGYFNEEVKREPEAYSLHFDLEEFMPGTHSVSVRLTRIDCAPGSMRSLMCNDGGHFFIGPRGAIRVMNSYRFHSEANGTKKRKAHLAFMLRGRVG